jgi:RHS repeat-associated protein
MESTRAHRNAPLLLISVIGVLMLSTVSVANPKTVLASSAYETNVLSHSPSAYWRLGEGSGNFSDDSGNGNTATANGTLTYGTTGAIHGDTDTAVTLDGSSAYAEAPSSASLNAPSSAITMEAWVNPTSGGFGAQKPIMLKSPTSWTPPYYQYGLFLDDQSGYPKDLESFFAIGGSLKNFDFLNSGWMYGSWNHVVVTYDGSYVRGYVNGHLVGTAALTGTLSSYGGPIDIGAYANVAKTSSYLFDGSLDEAAVYPTALTEEEVQTDYSYAYASTSSSSSSSTYTAQVVQDSPVGYWRADESSGPYLRDFTSHGNNAIATPSGVSYGAAGGTLSDSDAAVTLDGSSGFAEAPDSTSLNASTSAITMEALVRPDSSGTWTQQAILLKSFTSHVSPYYQYGMYLADTGGTPKDLGAVFSIGGNYAFADFPNSGWQYGVWNLVEITYDGSHIRGYVNGAEVGSPVAQTGNLNTYPTPLDIGAYANIQKTSASLFKGGVDDVAVYPSALSASRIKSHYLAAAMRVEPTGGAPGADELRGGGNNICLPCTISRVVHGSETLTPIDTENGNFYHDFVDVNIPGRSYPLAVTRTYNSDAASTDGPFGYGWNFDYGMSLAVTGSNPNQVATITQENGSQVTFNQPPSGNIWTASAPRYNAALTYNSGSSTWTFVRQTKDTYTFDSSGQVTHMTDANGYDTSLTYSAGKLSTVTDPAGRTLSFTWTGSHITLVTDANVSPNRTVSYSYDGSGNLQDVTDVNSGDTHFSYDGSHRVTTMKDPVCQALGGGCPGVQNHYDGNGRVDWQKDQLNRQTTFAYSGTPDSASGGTTLTTDPASNETLDTYQWGIRTAATKGYGTGAAATTAFMYDPDTLAVTGTMDPNGDVTTYTVDSHGNILTATDPLGRVTTNTYNGFNEVLTTEDGNGVTTTNTYDGNGNLTSTSRPLAGTGQNQETDYTYGNGSYPGDVTQVTDPNGKVTYFHYDANGYADEVKDPLGHVTGTVRNNDGWTTESYTPKAACTWNSSPPTGCSSTYKTAYTQDAFGTPLSITDPLSRVTTYTYDADEQQTTVQDGNGNTTTNAYDLAGELCWTLPGGTSANTCASPPTNARVTDYNGDGTIADQKDGKGNAILTYGYDPLGRVTSTTDALSNTTTYALDGNGNVLSKQEPGGNCATPTHCTTYTYDAANELKTVSYTDSSSENVTSVAYDNDGQRTAMTDGTGSSSWSFDSLHRLTSYTNGNGATVTYGYTYGGGPSYDLKNQVRSIAYPNSVGTVTQTWNDDGTLASVTDWNSKQTTFAYDNNANQTSQASPSTTNVTDTFGFNAADQMTSVSDSNGSTLFSATYTRDSNGQLASDSSQAGNQSAYKYTAQNQLCYAGSSASNACTSPPGSSYPYAFDHADNLTTNNGTTQQYNAADELCWSVSGASANACNSAPGGATTYGYDTKGARTYSVTSGTGTCNTYDQAIRLTQIKTGTGSTCTSPSTVGTYAYDGDGVRESKTVGGTTTQFAWDGAGGLLLQQDDGSTKTSFIYGPGGLPVEQVANSTNTYLHHDQLGSTTLITDSAGNTGTATTILYKPYGSVASTSGALTTPLMYTGQYLDSESGQYQLRARYYDPATAQFLTRDPAVMTTFSPYAYVSGNPLNANDPSGNGLCFVWDSNCETGANIVSNAVSGKLAETGHCIVGTPDCQEDLAANVHATENIPVVGVALRADPAMALFFDTAKAGSGENVSPWQLGSDIVGVLAFPAGGLAQGVSKIAGFGAGNWGIAAQIWNNRNLVNWGWTGISQSITHGGDLWNQLCGAI